MSNFTFSLTDEGGSNAALRVLSVLSGNNMRSLMYQAVMLLIKSFCQSGLISLDEQAFLIEVLDEAPRSYSPGGR